MRAMMLVPWAIPTVVAAQMWKWMYNDVFGVINDAGVRLHMISHHVAWIAQPSTALGAVAAVDIWKTTPFVALLLLAGLQVIPQRPVRGRARRRRERSGSSSGGSRCRCWPRRSWSR